MTRDQWNPFGLRDRGFFLIFAPLTAAAFVWMAFSAVSYRSLLIGMLLAMMLFRFLAAAYQGLMALVGQEKLMSGRLSVIWNVILTLPTVAGAFASGFISGHLRSATALIMGAAFTLCIGLFGLGKPPAVFSHVYDKPQASRASLIKDLKRLMKHRAVYPAVLINFLWNFAPGMSTPMQYYLTNTLRASDSVYSYYFGIFAGAFSSTYLLYGYLCQKVSLNKLLVWGTVLAIPQMIPLAFIHSAYCCNGRAHRTHGRHRHRRLLRSRHAGLSPRSAGNFDDDGRRRLLPGQPRQRPAGREDFGSSPTHGFLYCVIATTLVYALILPAILLVPRELMATADGQPNPIVEAEVLREIAETGPA